MAGEQDPKNTGPAGDEPEGDELDEPTGENEDGGEGGVDAADP
jgi:hypothetical protein